MHPHLLHLGWSSKVFKQNINRCGTFGTTWSRLEGLVAIHACCNHVMNRDKVIFDSKHFCDCILKVSNYGEFDGTEMFGA